MTPTQPIIDFFVMDHLKILPVEKNSTDALSPTSAEEYEKANKAWWELQWKKHQLALDYVTNLVLDKGYPEKLNLMGEMTEAEQEKIFDEAFSSFDLQKNDYWKTAYDLYDNDDSKTWPDVYEEIEKLRDEQGLVQRYSTFDSFKRNKSKYDKNRSSGIK